MELTKRQATLFGRIESLIERASRFPHPIVEIWGGGSLFRLEPSPNDADCVFRYEGTHSSWDWFASLLPEYEGDILETAKAHGLTSLPEADRAVIEWWCDSFRESDLNNWALVDPALVMPHLLTKRLIKRNYPRISVVELTPKSEPNAWRMELTKVWSLGESFELDRILNSAKHLEDSDRDKLLQQLAEFREATSLLIESIQNQDEAAFEKACGYAGVQGFQVPPALPKVKSSKSTADLRKLVKAESKKFEALRAAACIGSTDPEVIAMDAITSLKKLKDWGPRLVSEGILESPHLELAKFNVKHKFGRFGYDRLRLLLICTTADV